MYNLEKLYEILKKTKNSSKILRKILILEKREEYLKKWVSLTPLFGIYKEDFLMNANINDFILENIIFHQGRKKYNAWTCDWLLQRNYFVISRSFSKNDKKNKKYEIDIQSNITLSDVIINDTIEITTEYVICTAIKRDPTILQILGDNLIFSRFSK